MTTLINVKPTSYTSNGNVIHRKGYQRKLSDAKERVTKLRTALSKVKELTANDPQNLEYGLLLNNAQKENKKIEIIKGVLEEGGAHAIYLPVPKDHNTEWIIHSHPTSRPLSIQDIISSREKNGTIFAATTDGSVYRSTRLIPKGEENNKLLRQVYDEARSKMNNSSVVKDYFALTPFYYPDIPEAQIKEEIQGVVQHKILKHMQNKGLIRYRAKLSDIAKDKILRYKDILNIALKRNNKNIVNFSKYYISKNKWYKLPKNLRNNIRSIEHKYNNNYKLALKKEPKLKTLYKKAGVN